MAKHRVPVYLVPVFLSLVLLLILCVCFSGCYTLKQGTIMLGYLSRAIPLEALLDTPKQARKSSHNYAYTVLDTDEVNKNRLFVERVMDIRSFATEELGLKMSKNYTRYVHIDRDYLAAIVSACAADSFTSHEWKFPIVGTMPYKGFFNTADAYKESEKLKKKGLDVWIRKTDAFSTLGWFKDPLYSYMQDYSIDMLANLIIHELMHATVFVKNQMQFNEELAEIAGREGAQLYVENRFGFDSEEFRLMYINRADNEAYVSFVLELAGELEAVYDGSESSGEKLREKERIINDAKIRFDAEYESRFSGDGFRLFLELPVNNAYLELYRLYYGSDGFFSDLFENTGRDLYALIAAAKTLNIKDSSGIREPRQRLTKALGLEYHNP